MNNIAVMASSLLVGAAVGAFVSYKVTKTKIERAAKEEIEEVRKHYKDKYDNLRNGEAEKEEQSDIPEQSGEYEEDEDEDDYGSGREPYTISPDEFGELYDYDTTTLILYADGILAYEDGVRVKDVDDIVGIESLNKFGEYEDDTIYVRNENMQCDYEVYKDENKYSELYEIKSQQTEK